MKTCRPNILLRATLTGAVLASLAGCSSPVDETENFLPIGDVVRDNTQTETVVGDGPCDCITVGDWYRFTRLTLESIDGDTESALIPSLNGIWTDDIARDELNLFLEVIAVTADSLTMRAGAGARATDGTDICVVEETMVEVNMPRAGCAIGPTDETAINIYSGTPDHPKSCSVTLPVKHAIPLEQVIIEGGLDATCSEILGAKVVSGVLKKSSVGEICACLQLGQPDARAEDCGDLDPDHTGGNCDGCSSKYTNLATLLPILGEPDWTCTASDGTEGACVVASFDAVKTDFTPPSCQ